jgi:hypothetical protein
MSGKSSPRHGNSDKDLKREFGITPGAKKSVDPKSTPKTLPCDICGGEHPNHAIAGGD